MRIFGLGAREMTDNRIVILFDGTWNKPESSLPDATKFSSNIYKMWLALGGRQLDNSSELFAAQETEKGHLYYIRGVGTDGSRLNVLKEGALGSGTTMRLKLAYRWFCTTFTGKEEVFIFGFSRGAYAARSFCSLLESVGASSNTDEEKADALIGEYLDGSNYNTPVTVKYLGIFDTVGSIYDPFEKAREHRLSPFNVSSVRHALALDERREHWAPIYWGEYPDRKTSVSEAWFVGAHSNIGGGYANANLSNIALFWILKGAEHAGMRFDYPKLEGYEIEKAGDGIQNSWRQFIAGLPVGFRFVAEALEVGVLPRIIAKGQRIHESVSDAFNGGYDCGAQITAGAKLSPKDISNITVPWEFE